MELSIIKAWELFEQIRRNRETWGFDLGGEGGIEIEYDCLNAYKDSGKVKETANKLQLDDDIILQILQSFIEHIEAPKKDWLHYTPPPEPVVEEDPIITAPTEPLKQVSPYVEPFPFPRTVRKHMMAQQLDDQRKEEELFLKELQYVL